jgi:hypothetical protein
MRHRRWPGTRGRAAAGRDCLPIHGHRAAHRLDPHRQLQPNETEATSGRLETSLPATTLSQAIVRMCDAHLYAPLLGGTEPEIDTALDLVAALLSQLNRPHVRS